MVLFLCKKIHVRLHVDVWSFSALLLLHGGVDEALGKVAVAHEERTMEVGAEHILIDGALGVIFAVVAVTADDGA